MSQHSQDALPKSNESLSAVSVAESQTLLPRPFPRKALQSKPFTFREGLTLKQLDKESASTLEVNSARNSRNHHLSPPTVVITSPRPLANSAGLYTKILHTRNRTMYRPREEPRLQTAEMTRRLLLL